MFAGPIGVRHELLEQPVALPVGEDEGDDHGAEAVDQARTQLVEVLDEARLLTVAKAPRESQRWARESCRARAPWRRRPARTRHA